MLVVVTVRCEHDDLRVETTDIEISFKNVNDFTCYGRISSGYAAEQSIYSFSVVMSDELVLHNTSS